MSKFFTKTELEQSYFDSLRYFEGGNRWKNAQKSESPDFLVNVSKSLVGVEVTSLNLPQVRIESSQDKIVAASQQAAREQGAPAANVTLFFNLRHPLRRDACDALAGRVATVVVQNMPRQGEQVSLDMVDGQPSEVDLILISRSDIRSRDNWHWTEAGCVHRDIDHLIQSAIDKKSVLLSRYLEKCDECWLLIGVNSFRPSGKLRLHQDNTTAFRSPFKRTYFLDWGGGHLKRLTTSIENS